MNDFSIQDILLHDLQQAKKNADKYLENNIEKQDI